MVSKLRPSSRARKLWVNTLFCSAVAVAAAWPDRAAGAVPTLPNAREAAAGEPAGLAVEPSNIEFLGPRAGQQIVVTARYRDGSLRDLTSVCRFDAAASAVCRVDPGGWVEARGDGRTVLTVEVGGQRVAVPVVVKDFGRPRPVSFRNEVIAALNVAGCNQGACHGTPSGKGGFRLSLRGFDPAADYRQLTRDVLGRRTSRHDPASSLILQKALGLVPHEGGRRFAETSTPARTLRSWLAEGLQDDPAGQATLVRIDTVPSGRLLQAPARRQQFAVRATFSDGSARDVTRLTVFSSSDDAIARVDRNGLVEFQQPGEVAILCRYLEQLRAVRLTYLRPRPDFHWPSPPQNNAIDTHVFAKLKLLTIQPSDLCTDAEFLRRAFLDLCGIVPTPHEAKAFLADPSPGKRDRLIDTLLDRPEFADFWTFKWLDLLRSDRLTLQIKGVHAYRQWLRHHVAANTPWNEVVRDFLTASGSTFANPPANYYRGGPYNNRAAPVVRDAQGLAETTAQLFFGVRLQCAQCHNHPFERWTQDDYFQMAAWFARVKGKPDAVQPGTAPLPYPWMLREDAVVIYDARTGEVTQPRTGKVMVPKVLGMPAPVTPPGVDRRAVLARLVTAAENPFFARATVNRIWFHLLGRGIVDPPDDFRDSNPSANDALLDALAREFVEHRFDVKHIIRMVVRSRTYQLSAHTNATNREDDKYFSHALVGRKRLPAEVLLDAICAATGMPEKYTGVPPGTRATQLPDAEVIYTGGRYATWEMHAFVKAFGAPAREKSCECEREGDVSLGRVLELKNGSFLQGKLRAPLNRLGRLLARKAPDAEVVEELFLATLSRPPAPEEARSALDVVRRATDKRAAWESVHWALLNTNEFLLRY